MCRLHGERSSIDRHAPKLVGSLDFRPEPMQTKYSVGVPMIHRSKSTNQVDFINFMSCCRPPRAVSHCHRPQRLRSKQNCYSSSSPLELCQQMIYELQEQG